MDIEYIISSLDCERLEQLMDTAPTASRQNMMPLQHKLERATVVAPDEIPTDAVTMNSKVEFLMSHTSEPLLLTLVYPREVTEVLSTLSILAPIGTALLGCRQGFETKVDQGHGLKSNLRVLKVHYQPERSGQLHR